MVRHTLFGLLFCLATMPIAAQQQAAGWARWEAPRLEASAAPALAPASSGGSIGRLVGGGILGGAVGVVAGGLAGAVIGGGNAICGDDSCGLEEAVCCGNYGLSLLASAALVAAGILAVDVANDGWPLIPVPIAQPISSILIERATSREQATVGAP